VVSLPSKAAPQCVASPLVTGVRDRAILELLYGTGMRRSELMRLQLGDVGNLKSKGTQNFGFDLDNRLISSPGGNYAYDGLGRRTKIVSSDGSTRIQVYSQAGQLLWATSTGGPRPASTTAYIYLAGKQIAEVQTTGGVNATQYVHTDALGSPVAHSTSANPAVVINRSRFEPYGYVAQGMKPSANTSVVGFTGHVQDAETDLVYMQQRYYDPIAGRFLSVDPLVTDANTGKSFGRYHYANNSPYKFIDPDGKDSIILQFGGSAVLGVGVEGSLGVYVTGLPNPDIGVFASGGYGVGANVGLSAQIGVVPGHTSNISGDTKNTNVSTVVLSGTVMRDAKTGKVVGGTVGPAAKLGVSQTNSTTGTAGLRDCWTKSLTRY